MVFFNKNTKIKLVALCTLFVFTCFNSYLSYNNLAIYSHATSDHAIENIRWGMSPKQIELATDSELRLDHINNQYQIFSQKMRLTDRARLSHVKLYFYEEQLYKLQIHKDLSSYGDHITEQLIDKAGFTQDKDIIKQRIKNGQRYKKTINNNTALIYLSYDSSNNSSDIYFTLGYEPLMDMI